LKAVILAAGEGTRLRPFTVSRPKVMIPIANRPIIEYAVEALSQNGICDIVLVVGYKKESIMSYFEEGKKFGVNISYVTQQKPLGTAHALLQAKKEIESEFLVLPGDNLIDPKEVSNLLESKGASSLLIAESEIPSKYGVVFLERDKVTKIMEKPEEKLSNLISTGIYRFTPEVFQIIESVGKKGENDLTAVVEHMIENGEDISGIRGIGKWVDAVYPWDIIHVNASAITDAAQGTAGNIEEDVVIKGQVFIGEETIVRSGSYITGPVVIGKGCDIGPNVCIFPSTSIGDNVSVQPFSLIRHSVLMNDVQIGSSSTICNSVLGEGVRIGSHFVANNGKALVEIESQYHTVNDIGAIIGEDSDIGDQVVAQAGVIIGARCKVSPFKRVEGSIPNKGIVV
jgi:glucose-1-phosphate thymidylyltransferase